MVQSNSVSSYYCTPYTPILLCPEEANAGEKFKFLDEIEMMKTITSSGGNPHVVKMVGCATSVEPFCLLTEYVYYGDLFTYLNSIRSMVSVSTETESFNINL